MDNETADDYKEECEAVTPRVTAFETGSDKVESKENVGVRPGWQSFTNSYFH